MLARLEAIDGVERAEVDYRGELLRLRASDAALAESRGTLAELGYDASDNAVPDARVRWYGSSTVRELSRVEANVIAGRVVPGFLASRGGLAAADEDRLLAAVADALYEYFRAHTLDATSRPGALRSACADEVAKAAAPIVGHRRAQELRAIVESDLGASERAGS